MTIGMGLFLLGVNLTMAALYMSSKMSDAGFKRARIYAVFFTVIGLLMTGFQIA